MLQTSGKNLCLIRDRMTRDGSNPAHYFNRLTSLFQSALTLADQKIRGRLRGAGLPAMTCAKGALL